MVDSTRATLLMRVKDRDDGTAWRDFNRIYFPLLFRYARGRGLSATDAEDVAQQCMQTVSRAIAGFDYSSAKGRFRGWLRTMVDHKVTDVFRRRRETLGSPSDFEQMDASGPSPDELWEQQWEKEHLRFCLDRLREELPAKTYQCFLLYALQQKRASEVAQLLGISESQVWVTKSRVLDRLQRMMAEWFG